MWNRFRKSAGHFAVGVAIAVTGGVSVAEKPNIVLFLVDDLGLMDTSVPFLTDDNGDPVRHPLNDFYRTPAMEHLAERGARFNQFYAMSVCSPSRVSILTGQHAARHRTTNWINPWQNNAGPHGPPDWQWEGLKAGDVTLPGLLREKGYRTIHIGKAHFGPEGSEGADPRNLGFDINIGGRSIGQPGSYFGEENFGHGTQQEQTAVPHLEAYHGTDIFLTEALTLEANRVLAEAVEDGVPFFLHLSHYAVHAPFQADPRFAAQYADSGHPPPVQAYATLVEGMDKSLGDVLAQLDALGVAESTLVVFVGDNGSDAPLGHAHEVGSTAPLRGKKGSHYEGGFRVPFIMAWARHAPDNRWQQRLPIAAGGIQSQVADITDLFPTLLPLAGVSMPENHAVDGHALNRLLTGEPDPSRPEQFLLHYPHGPHRSNYFTVWRDGDWKAIFHALPDVPAHGDRIQSGGRHYELFNLKDDPYEQHDLADTEPDTLRRMIRGMRDALVRYEALYPLDENGRPLRPVVP